MSVFVNIHVKALFDTTCHNFRHVTFSPAISELREAAEKIWHRVIMAIVKSSLCLTTILHGSFMLSFKNSPFTLEFQMPRGQKVSHLLATSSKFLVANAQFLVALATSQSQCRTLLFFPFKIELNLCICKKLVYE